MHLAAYVPRSLTMQTPPDLTNPETLAGLAAAAKYVGGALASSVAAVWGAAKWIIPTMFRQAVHEETAPQFAAIRSELAGKADAADLTRALDTIGSEMRAMRESVQGTREDVAHVRGMLDAARRER